jgi:hypothetical protein
MIYRGTCRCQLEWPNGFTSSSAAGVILSSSVVVVPPPVEPLTLAEVKLDRRVDHDLDDSLLSALIQAAREYCEGYNAESLVQQTREVLVSHYVEGMALPYGPVQDVVSVEGDEGAPVTVQYVAGYPTIEGEGIDYTANIPQSYKVAMKLLIGDWYEHRENTIVGAVSSHLQLGVHALLGWYRRRLGVA